MTAPVDPDKVFLTQREAAVVAGVNPRIIRRWTRAGVIPVFVDPDSKRVLYPRPALLRWAAGFTGEVAS